MKLPVRFSIGAMVLLGVALIAFTRLNQFRFSEHKRIDGQLDHIEKLDLALNQTVLLARFRLISDYDTFNAQLEALQAATTAAGDLPSFIPSARQHPYQQKLGQFRELLTQKEVLLEKFKSGNAVLNNSLQYLPVAGTELLAKLAKDPESRALEERMNLLMREILVHCLHDGDDETPALREVLQSLNAWRAEHPDHPESKTVEQIMAHARAIMTRKPQIEALTQQIVSLPTSEGAAELLRLYEVELARALDRGNTLQVVLEGLCGLLALAVTYTILALAAAQRDLERRVVERTDALRQTNRRFEIVTAATTNVIWDWDLNANTVWWNENFQTVFGYSADEVGSGADSWTSRIHPDDADEVISSIREAIFGGKLWSREYRFRRRDGTYAFVFDRGRVVHDECGRSVRMIGAMQDFTERRQAEEELRDSEHRYRDLVVSLPAALYTCDVQGRITLFNEAAAKLWGRQPELGKDRWCGSAQICELDGRPVAREQSPVAVAIRDGQAIRGRELIIERPDGSRRFVLPHPTLLRDSGGSVVGAINMLVDLSERHRAEEEMEKLHRQLLETSRQAGMAEVATGVLHNVGNVLNSVNVSATLVAESVRKSKASSLGRVVALIDQHVADLGTFVTSHSQGRNLPAFLRQLHECLHQEQQGIATEVASLRKNIEHINEIVSMQQSYAKVSGVVEVLQIVDLVEDSLRMNEGALNRHEVGVVREYEEVPRISLEKHKALQILVNLIRNAKYACDEGGAAEKFLTVRVSNGEGTIRISIIDNGVGIPPENLTRIFNHGFTTRKDGHGFGLHSGALAAKELGGALTVQSKGLGCGASFTLELPGLAEANLIPALAH